MNYRYVDATFLQGLERLDFRPQHYARGWLPGRHRSPFRGTSVEFSEHRAYAPGDDPRQLDWRVYARQDRLTVRLREGEVRTSVHLLLDTSASMGYGEPSKFHFAICLALGFAYLLLRQQDTVSLWTLGHAPNLPPGSGMPQFHRLVRMSETLNPEGRQRMTGPLRTAIQQVPRHGIWLIFSDCLEPLDDLRETLQQVRYAGHEAALWHVLHPDERELPFTGPTELLGLEGGKFRIEANQFRTAYQVYVREFCAELRSICHQESVDYIAPDITQPVLGVLTEYLTQRLAPGTVSA